jgi:ribulose kinase
MMPVQLDLPAGWASNFLSRRDPRDRLAMLREDVWDAKAEIRSTLERLAEKHGLPMKEVTQAMGAVDDGLSDLVYDHERALILEIEDEDHA